MSGVIGLIIGLVTGTLFGMFLAAVLGEDKEE